MRSDIQENVNNAKVTAGCVKHSTALFPSPVLQVEQSEPGHYLHCCIESEK